MDLFKAQPEICTENILGYISQKDIMEKYLGISVDHEGMFCSPLRDDKKPTCTFSWNNGKLYFRDWARERPLDCFGVVMEMYDVHFHDAQKIIAKDFNIRDEILSGKPKNKIKFNQSENEKSIIKVKVQPFTKHNVDYLKSYNLTSNLCKKFNVYSPKYVWLNDKLQYVQDDSNPAIAYYFGLDDKGNPKWKIYYYIQKERYRFLCNTNRINGWIQIPDVGDTLIFTKSLKDVMCLDLFDIPAVAMQAETQTPYDYIIDKLQSRYKRIISLFDYDSAGIRRAMTIHDKYDIPYYFIQDENAKDFSDYIQYYGVDKTKELISKILNE